MPWGGGSWPGEGDREASKHTTNSNTRQKEISAKYRCHVARTGRREQLMLAEEWEKPLWGVCKASLWAHNCNHRRRKIPTHPKCDQFRAWSSWGSWAPWRGRSTHPQGPASSWDRQKRCGEGADEMDHIRLRGKRWPRMRYHRTGDPSPEHSRFLTLPKMKCC